MTTTDRIAASHGTAAYMKAISAQRIGMAGYAKIIWTLRGGPVSTTEIAERNGVSRLLVLLVMRHCLRAGIVHRCDWFRPQPHARMVPKWALGRDGDVSMPLYEEKTRKPRKAPSTLMLLTTVLQLLEVPTGYADLVEELRMHPDSVRRAIRTLRDHGLVYIASWHKPPTGTTSPEFMAGQKRDVPRPERRRNKASALRQFRARRNQLQALHALAGTVYRPMAPAAPRATAAAQCIGGAPHG